MLFLDGGLTYKQCAGGGLLRNRFKCSTSRSRGLWNPQRAAILSTQHQGAAHLTQRPRQIVDSRPILVKHVLYSIRRLQKEGRRSCLAISVLHAQRRSSYITTQTMSSTKNAHHSETRPQNRLMSFSSISYQYRQLLFQPFWLS